MQRTQTPNHEQGTSSLGLLDWNGRRQQAVLACQVIGAYNLTRLVQPKGLGQECAGEIHGAEIASNQRKGS